jgi:FkbM family methyltransferase
MKKLIKRLLPYKYKTYINSFRFPDKEVDKKTKFYSQLIDQGDLVFDVGANIGNRLPSFLNLKAKVVAIEPQEDCMSYLRLKFGKKVILIQKGLGEKQEDKEMYISNSNTISSFSKEWIESVQESGRFSEVNWNKRNIIEMTTLDNLINELGIPKFIKIDVEGYELEVLKGLSKNVPMLSIEYTVPEQIDKTIQCIKYLASINGNIKCNYSVEEYMAFEMDKWVSATEMINIVNSSKFIMTGFGDIYINMK